MRYLIAIAVAAFVAGAGLAVNSVGSLPLEKQSTPTARPIGGPISAVRGSVFASVRWLTADAAQKAWRHLLKSAASGGLSGPVR